MLKVFGLTGGIGSGKSAVAQVIRDQGIPVLDADVISRQVTVPGQPAYHDIARAWPDAVGGDGSLDRKKLAEIVFADPERRKRLEAITHPRIREQVATETSALAAQGHRLAFFEAALLVETGFYRQLDGLVVVTAEQETRIQRVIARDGASRENVLARIRAQLPMEDKLKVADYVIENSGTWADTTRQVLSLLARLRPPRR